eukprot:scaffold15108_cov180-Amphora_coffeaeformis.AAC.79
MLLLLVLLVVPATSWMVLPSSIKRATATTRGGSDCGSPCSPVLCWASSSSSSSPTAKPFGRQDYWESFYQERRQQGNNNNDSNNIETNDEVDADDEESSFTWYAGWNDLEPFLREFIQPEDRILIPGAGMDSLVLNMYDAGYHNLTVLDYAQASMAYFERRREHRAIQTHVADARDLHRLFPTDDDESSCCFDVVLDKGTLDAISIAGETAVEKHDNFIQATREFQRILKPGGGILWSLSGICADKLVSEDLWGDQEWEILCDGSFFTTADGYTSNNFDSTLLVWRKK